MKLDADTCLRYYEEAKTLRAPYEADWRAAAQLALPGHVKSWQTLGASTGNVVGGNEAARRIYDGTMVKALPKWAAILERILTPRTLTWHTLRASNKQLMKIRAVKLYFDELNECLFSYRYAPRARYTSAQFENYISVGVYGNGIKWVDKLRKRPGVKPGIHYRTLPLRNCYLLLNEEENPDTLIRAMYPTARQFAQKFGDVPREKWPPLIKAELDKPYPSPSNTFEIIHVVAPRDDFDPGAFNSTRFPIGSVYVSVKDRMLIGEPGGFNTKPDIPARYFTEPGNTYGSSVAMLALAAAGSANAMKKTNLRQGQKAADPPLLVHDDGAMRGGIDIRPGSLIVGGISRDGKKLVQSLEGGNFQVTKEMLDDERQDINDAFLVSLFNVVLENPDMKATAVIEMAAEKAAILAPTMGRMQSEDLGPTIEREIDVLNQMGLLPEMPPELKEAEGEYDVVYTSPLARSQRAEEVGSFMRLSEFTAMVAQQTGEPRIMRRLNYDAAIPEIAEFTAVPARWITSDAEMAAYQEQDTQQAQVDQMVQAAPAIAGVAKASATLMNQTPKGGA